MTEDVAFEGWVKLEIMGFRHRYGYARDVKIAGGSLLRIDIPTDDGDVSEFYGASAIFCMTPTAEEICRDRCKGSRGTIPRPVQYRIEDDSTAPAAAAPAAAAGEGNTSDIDDDQIEF